MNGFKHLAITLSLLLVAAPPVLADLQLKDVTCDAFMFRNDDSRHPVSEFSPRDKIVIRAKFKNLKPGQFKIHTEWYNPTGRLQETSVFDHTQRRQGTLTAQSWIQLQRAGFFKRTFSVSNSGGYSVAFYGQWQVVISINGEKMVSQTFTVK